MESNGKQRQKMRWLFGSNPSSQLESPSLVRSPRLRHARTFQASRLSQSPFDRKTRKASSPQSWNTARQLGRAFRRSSPRSKSFSKEDHHESLFDCEQPSTPKIRIAASVDADSEQKSTKAIRRSMTMPEKNTAGLLVKSFSSKSNKPSAISTFILTCQEKAQPDSLECVPASTAYELVPKAKSMLTPTSSPRRSPKGFRFRQGSNRRENLMIRRTLLPKTDEESSLKTEELVGYECIDTSSTWNRSVSNQEFVYESNRSLSSNSSRQLDTRQDASDRGDQHEEREYDCASYAVSTSPSLEVSTPISATKSFASQTSRTKQHPSISMRGGSNYRFGTLNRFFSSFSIGREYSAGAQSSRRSSRYGSTVRGDNDVSTYWTEATSRQNDDKDRSSSDASFSHSSSRSSSISSSSDSSSEEEDDGEEEDDEDESFSFASNSTLSTRDSEANKNWEATVLFSKSLLDKGTEVE